MSLFQKVIVKKYLKNLASDLITENYKKYSEYFNDFDRAERIRTLKEEQYQEGFLRELFVDCLNYTINPNENFNLTTEFKNKTDAEKADGAILKDGNPIAVIELKSTKTKDLRTIEKQAFNYKTHQTNCNYVITSNFEKIRLYIDDATEFEEFNVFQLSENDFKFLYLCLNKDSIYNDIPAEMKEKSNQHEDLISKKLYHDYSYFRNKIFQNLTKNNTQIDKLILFKKSQKLLDRFLFIFFAEDKGLIPANMISKIIDEFNKLKEMDHYTPLFSEVKRFFGYINKGNSKYNIDEYNGGLFQFDEILDNVIIDDEILIEDSLKLSNYDFDSEVDVNILGHIFEHSLTDIEKLNAEISGEYLDKKQTRRKKEGVFYTPNYITKYIVENTIGSLCEEKKKELKLINLEVNETYFRKSKNAPSKKGEQLFDRLEKYKEWLLSLKILDPACGSGAFLNQALNFLIDEHNFIIDLETDLRKGQLSLFDIDTAVLENNLYGVDINEESIEIAQLSLWLKTAKRGRKLTDLSQHIKCGNSLIDDSEIAGEKAFDWNKEFPEIMQSGGFDIVIGNPPYAGRNSSIGEKEKQYVRNNFSSYEGKFELYQLFIERCMMYIKEKRSYVSLITPQTWLSIIQATKLRKFILSKQELSEIVFLGKDIFIDASVDSIIFTIQIGKKHNFIRFIQSKDLINDSNHLIKINYSSIDKINSIIPISSSLNAQNLISKINHKAIISENIGTWSDGIKIVGEAKTFAFQKNKENEDFHPMIIGKDISKYSLEWSGIYCCRNKSQIENHNANDIRLRNDKMFLRPKILIRKTGNKIVSTIDLKNYYYEQSLFSFGLKNNNFDLKYILIIINSRLSNFLLKENPFSKKETFPQIRLHWLKKIPIKQISIEAQQPFIKIADLMLSLNEQKQEQINTFLHRLETNFEFDKLSNKMKAFYDYDFKTLLSEVKKKKVKLSLSQQDEWEEYFNNYKNEINELQKQIDKTDKEIDQMVYELYGLTKEEVEIVEKG